MSQFKFLFVGALAATFALPLAARADSAECELRAFKANRVEPLRIQERIGRGTIEKLAGAQVFVPAQKGLTAEWLRARVEQHISGMGAQGMAELPAQRERDPRRRRFRRHRLLGATAGQGLRQRSRGSSPCSGSRTLTVEPLRREDGPRAGVSEWPE